MSKIAENIWEFKYYEYYWDKKYMTRLDVMQYIEQTFNMTMVFHFFSNMLCCFHCYYIETKN